MQRWRCQAWLHSLHSSGAPDPGSPMWGRGPVGQASGHWLLPHCTVFLYGLPPGAGPSPDLLNPLLGWAAVREQFSGPPVGDGSGSESGWSQVRSTGVRLRWLRGGLCEAPEALWERAVITALSSSCPSSWPSICAPPVGPPSPLHTHTHTHTLQLPPALVWKLPAAATERWWFLQAEALGWRAC